MDIVDAQLHLSLAPDAEEIGAEMAALGIKSVVFDELWGRNALDHGIPCVEFPDGAYRPMSPCAQVAALRYPDRFSYLQRITRRDPQLSALIAILASSPGCRSLRIVVADRQEREVFTAGGYDTLLGLAQSHGLPICILSKDSGILLRGAAARFPDLNIVLDHCGWSKTAEQWSEILELARHPNLYLKWSHAHRAFGQSGKPQENIQSALLQAINAFGVERILWASDLTHEETGASWADLLSFVRDNPALAPGDKEWILGKSARRVLRWNTPQG